MLFLKYNELEVKKIKHFFSKKFVIDSNITKTYHRQFRSNNFCEYKLLVSFQLELSIAFQKDLFEPIQFEIKYSHQCKN